MLTEHCTIFSIVFRYAQHIFWTAVCALIEILRGKKKKSSCFCFHSSIVFLTEEIIGRLNFSRPLCREQLRRADSTAPLLGAPAALQGLWAGTCGRALWAGTVGRHCGRAHRSSLRSDGLWHHLVVCRRAVVNLYPDFTSATKKILQATKKISAAESR